MFISEIMDPDTMTLQFQKVIKILTSYDIVDKDFPIPHFNEGYDPYRRGHLAVTWKIAHNALTSIENKLQETVPVLVPETLPGSIPFGIDDSFADFVHTHSEDELIVAHSEISKALKILVTLHLHS